MRDPHGKARVVSAAVVGEVTRVCTRRGAVPSADLAGGSAVTCPCRGRLLRRGSARGGRQRILLHASGEEQQCLWQLVALHWLLPLSPRTPSSPLPYHFFFTLSGHRGTHALKDSHHDAYTAPSELQQHQQRPPRLRQCSECENEFSVNWNPLSSIRHSSISCRGRCCTRTG